MTEKELERLEELDRGEKVRSISIWDAGLCSRGLVLVDSKAIRVGITQRGARALEEDRQRREAINDAGLDLVADPPPPPSLDEPLEEEGEVVSGTSHGFEEAAVDQDDDDLPFAHYCDDNDCPPGCTKGERRQA